MKKYQCYNTWEETYSFAYEAEIEAETKEEAREKFKEAFYEVLNNNEGYFDKFSVELIKEDMIPEITIEEMEGK